MHIAKKAVPVVTVAVTVAFLLFAPPAGADAPESGPGATPGRTVTVTPSDNLSDQQTVQVEVNGFTAFDFCSQNENVCKVSIEQCFLDAAGMFQCGPRLSNDEGPVTVSRTFTTVGGQTHTCTSSTNDCFILVSVSAFGPFTSQQASHHISFADPTTPPGNGGGGASTTNTNTNTNTNTSTNTNTNSNSNTNNNSSSSTSSSTSSSQSSSQSAACAGVCSPLVDFGNPNPLGSVNNVTGSSGLPLPAPTGLVPKLF